MRGGWRHLARRQQSGWRAAAGGWTLQPRCALGRETSPEGVAQALADIEAAAARVESAFAAIRAFEDAHPTNFKVRQCAVPRTGYYCCALEFGRALTDLNAWSWGQEYVSDLFSVRAVDATPLPGMPLGLHQHHLRPGSEAQYPGARLHLVLQINTDRAADNHLNRPGHDDQGNSVPV